MKRILFLLPILLVLALSFAGHAQAKTRVPVRPLVQNCPSCSTQLADFAHLANNHGLETDMTVDNYNIDASFTHYEKKIDASNAAGDWVEVGIMTHKDNSFACGTGTHYFYNSSVGGLHCYSININDINKLVHFGISYYVSNGGGAFVWIDQTPAGDNPCSPCSIPGSTYTAKYNSEDFYMQVLDTNIDGDEIWGGAWESNQTFDGTNWNYFTQNYTRSFGPPPQMYWNVSPTIPGAQGGTLYSCVYDSITESCNLGS